MKKGFFKVVTTLLFVLAVLVQSAFAADFSKMVILHTNDTHGFDAYSEPHNGLAILAQLKKDLTAQGYNVILLDAGDCSQDNNLVNFSKGRAAFEFFNATGYDAGCLGNHEFDYGQEILMRNVGIANYPILSCNIIKNATKETLVPANAILQQGDVKIGVIGFTTPETVVSTNPKNVYGLTFLQKEKLYAEARKQVKEMKNAGCDLIIGVGHMGSSPGCMGNRSDDILENVDGFDIFVDGHDHLVKNRWVNNALLVEAGKYTDNIGYIHYVNDKWQEDMIKFGTLTAEDLTVKKMIDAEQAKIDASMGQVLGVSDVELNGNRNPGCRTEETNSGDFIADAYLWQARKADVLGCGVDIAIVNGGSIRNGIPAGEVKRANVNAMAPYNNQLVVFKVKGSKLLEIFEAATCILPDEMGALPQVAGMKYTVDTKVPFTKGAQYENSVYYVPAEPGSRVTIEEVGGKPFNPEAEYTIVATDFVVIGGDAYGGLTAKDAIIEKQALGSVDEEVIENYIIEGLGGKIGKEYAAPQGRFVIK